MNLEDEPAETRVEYLQHVVSRTLMPFELRAADSGLPSQVRNAHEAQIGPVTVVNHQVSALQVIRTSALIRNSDSGLSKLNLGIRGRAKYEQEDRQHLLLPGEFNLMEFRRPSRVAVEATQEVSIIVFPRELLPLRDRDMRDLAAVSFSAQDPYAALVASLGREMTRHLDSYEAGRDARIGTAFLDLLALAVATRLDRVFAVDPDSRQRAMAARISAFIEEHLGDPGLSPALIAAAHHISVRTLHKLFEAEDETVAASIRRRRLERCRRDLLDPLRHRRPVVEVGARWGFQDPAAFSRVFRAAYGLPPAEYRAVHADGHHTRAH
jgi:AraC-like DNA-binding protein